MFIIKKIDFLKAYLNDINIIKMPGTGKIWISIDPVNGRINIYPKWVAIKIEEKYKLFVNCRNTRHSNTLFNHQTLDLGVDFFIATIHLSKPNIIKLLLDFMEDRALK